AFEVTSSITLPNITIPKAESNWIRMPTQVGDKGWTVPADAYLGAISGLGGGTPTLSRPHNLAALVFVPVSNKNDPPITRTRRRLRARTGQSYGPRKEATLPASSRIWTARPSPTAITRLPSTTRVSR